MKKDPEDPGLCCSILRIMPETTLMILGMLTALAASQASDLNLILLCGDGMLFIALAAQLILQIATLIAYSMFLTRHGLACMQGISRTRNLVWTGLMLSLVLAIGGATLVVSWYTLKNNRPGCQAALSANQTGVQFAPYIGILCAVVNAVTVLFALICELFPDEVDDQ